MQQTQTPVSDDQTLLDERRRAALRAHRALCGVMLFMQLYAGEALYVMRRAGSSSALSCAVTLLFVLPTFLWTRGEVRASGKADLKQALGALWPAAAVCVALSLLVDMGMLLLLIEDLSKHLLLPTYSPAIAPLLAALGAALSVAAGQQHGMARYAFLMRGPLFAAMVICLISITRYVHVSNLFPYLGQRVDTTALSAVWLLGAGWGVLLLLLPPEDAASTPNESGMRGPRTILGTYMAALLLLLMLNLTQPIYSFSRELTYSGRALMVMESYPSVVFWTLLIAALLFTLFAALGGAARMTQRVMPRVKGRSFPAFTLALLLPAAAAAAFFPDWSEAALVRAAPWRALLALVPAGILTARRLIQKEAKA